MELQPGESTQLVLEFSMPAGMGGPHDFRVLLHSNDPQQPVLELHVLSNWTE